MHQSMFFFFKCRKQKLQGFKALSVGGTQVPIVKVVVRMCFVF